MATDNTKALREDPVRNKAILTGYPPDAGAIHPI